MAWGRGAVAAAVVLALMTASASAQRARPGEPAPEIDLKTLEGNKVRLSDFRGHPVVVAFWATWCPSCRQEFPALVAAERKHQNVGLKVLGVNSLEQERREADVREFVTTYSVTFPIALDRGRYRRAYSIKWLPTTVFIDSAGVIRRVVLGPVSQEILDRGLAEILSPTTTPPA